MGNRSTSLLMEWWIETRRCFPKWIPSSLCNFSRSLTLKTPPLKLHYPTPLYRRPFIGIWNVLFVFIHSKWLLWWILVEGGRPNSLLWKRFPEIKRKRVKVISISLLLPLPTSLSLFLPLSLSLSLNFSLALLFSIVNIVFFLQLRRDSERAEFPGNDECVGIQTLLLVTAESLARRL